VVYIKGTIPALSSRDYTKLQKASVKVAGNPPEI